MDCKRTFYSFSIVVSERPKSLSKTVFDGDDAKLFLPEDHSFIIKLSEEHAVTYLEFRLSTNVREVTAEYIKRDGTISVKLIITLYTVKQAETENGS
ncbi:hypothetical protein DPMN_060891 [Dreissena polymorpha]|uniref:Uncharacterized protein n=1 Tax=Dreissena polymorpha TaxID=45954 RepID=A0A9D4C621_DREPO|nr:hypothetical protein DPMN_060891 [Dreissena polymorpha]